MNTKESKAMYFSYEEAGLKNPLFVPSFMTSRLQVFDPDFIDRKYFTNVFRDNPEYFIIKNHIKKLNDYFYIKDSGIDDFRISKICLKSNDKNKFKIIYVVSGTAPNYINGSMIYPIDNGTNNDCLVIHKDILRAIIKNKYTYTYYDDPLFWFKNLFTFLYGEDFLKEGRKYKNYNFMKMSLLVSLYGIHLCKMGFIDFLFHITEKYSLGMFSSQIPEENKNDLIALKSLIALLIDANTYSEDFERYKIIFNTLNSLQSLENKNFSIEDMNDLVSNKLDGLNNRKLFKECETCKKECDHETRLLALVDARVNDLLKKKLDEFVRRMK